MSDNQTFTNNINLFNRLELNSVSDILWDKTIDQRPLSSIEDIYPNYQSAQRIIVIDMEIYSTWNKKIISACPNLHIFAPTNTTIINSQIHSYQYWFNRVKFAEHHNKYCQKIKKLEYKPYLFDVLTGNNLRSHKRLVRKFALQSNNVKKLLIGPPLPVCFADTTTNWVLGCDEHKGCKKVDSDNNSNAEYIKLKNSLPLPGYCPFIDDVQYNIYNQSWYSVVCETVAYASHPFFSEKTARPLASKRVFVAFAPQYYLKNLEGLGFKTFNEIIDESYDNEPDHEKRMHMAWKQVELLCASDPLEVYKMAMPIVEHNKKVFFETDWTDQVQLQIKNIV